MLTENIPSLIDAISASNDLASLKNVTSEMLSKIASILKIEESSYAVKSKQANLVTFETDFFATGSPCPRDFIWPPPSTPLDFENPLVAIENSTDWEENEFNFILKDGSLSNLRIDGIDDHDNVYR